MYVIADVEWLQNKAGRISPTQLAAVRVDSDWNVVDRFDTFIRPMDATFHQWGHIAYMAGSPSEYLYARNCYNAFQLFRDFVGEDTVCWWFQPSAELHAFVNKIILKAGEPKTPVILSQYIPGFLDGQDTVKGSPYRVAEARGIDVPAIQHDARNDVEAILNLLRGIGFPQEALTQPPIKPIPRLKKPGEEGLEYQYDVANGLLHKRGCPWLPEDADIFGYGALATPLRKNLRPCSCVRSEVRAAKRERVIDEIARTEYSYIYAVGGSVYHRYDCGLMHNATHVQGTVKYASVLEKGLRPCKVCRPTASDQLLSVYEEEIPVERKEKRLPKTTYDGLTRYEMAAVNRQQQSRSERFSHADTSTMTPQQKKDFYTLTQPRYAFFAAQGYLNFHTRNCRRLNGISGIRGFDTYAHARRAGFYPCKHCKPTGKLDLILSIPIESRVRTDETVDDLVTLCNQYGYPHSMKGADFLMETGVGKWKIHTDARPVTLHHINLSRDPNCEVYHKQPRIFLSMLDAVRYIHRHDNNLLEDEAPGLPEDTHRSEESAC